MRLIIALALSLMLAAPAWAIDATRQVLPNGLTVLHMQRGGLPLVVVSIMVRAGALEEPAPGVASMTARLMDEGTTHRSSEQISSEAEFIGADLSVGAIVDYAELNLTVLKKDLDKGFEMLSDVMLNPTFPEAELARQKVMVKNGLKASEDSPKFLAMRAFTKEVFGPQSPYGRQLEGAPEAIDALTTDALKSFHKARYAPNASIMAVAGDISEAELKAMLDKYFAGWTPREVPQNEPPMPPARTKGETKILIDKPDLTQATILLGHHGIRRNNPDYYAAAVMNYVLGGGGFSSRLMDRVRDDLGLAYDVRSTLAVGWKDGNFHIAAQTKNKSATSVVEESLAAMRKMRESGVTAQELADAKAYMIGSFPRRLETLHGIAGFLGAIEFYGLGMDYDKDYKRIIAGISEDDIKRVARKYLDPDNYALVVVARQSEAGLK